LPLTSWRTEGSNYAGRNRASAVLSKQRGRAMRRPGSPGTANPGLTSGLPRVVQGSKKRPPQPGGATAKGRGSQEGWEFTLPGRSFTCTFRAAPLRAASLHAGRPGLGTGFQRPSFNGSNSNRALASPAFGGCSFLRDSRAERHSAVQRIPRSHSSASLRSKSALSLSSSARASLRYRTARALLMASRIPTQQNKDSSTGKRFWFRGPPNRFRLALASRRPDSFSEACPHSPSPRAKPASAAPPRLAQGRLRRFRKMVSSHTRLTPPRPGSAGAPCRGRDRSVPDSPRIPDPAWVSPAGPARNGLSSSGRGSV
jgi:hypothetical protein